MSPKPAGILYPTGEHLKKNNWNWIFPYSAFQVVDMHRKTEIYLTCDFNFHQGPYLVKLKPCMKRQLIIHEHKVGKATSRTESSHPKHIPK